MARLNIADLPLPPPAYRCDRSAGPEGFETEAEARQEDKTRARLLRRTSRTLRSSRKRRSARRLARALSLGKGVRSGTMASNMYMREQRIRVGGGLWQLADAQGLPQLHTFSLIPDGCDVPGGRLGRVDPRHFIRALRADLYRNGAAAADGYLCAFLDGEYEIASDAWRLHFHGVVAGGMLQVVESLRGTRKYRSSRPRDGTTRSIQRVRIDRSLENLPSPLLYTLKGFWSARWEGVIGDKKVRRSTRCRIPEPRHSELLLWLNQWSLADITLLTKVHVGRQGFSVG